MAAASPPQSSASLAVNSIRATGAAPPTVSMACTRARVMPPAAAAGQTSRQLPYRPRASSRTAATAPRAPRYRALSGPGKAMR